MILLSNLRLGQNFTCCWLELLEGWRHPMTHSLTYLAGAATVSWDLSWGYWPEEHICRAFHVAWASSQHGVWFSERLETETETDREPGRHHMIFFNLARTFLLLAILFVGKIPNYSIICQFKSIFISNNLKIVLFQKT